MKEFENENGKRQYDVINLIVHLASIQIQPFKFAKVYWRQNNDVRGMLSLGERIVAAQDGLPKCTHFTEHHLKVVNVCLPRSEFSLQAYLVDFVEPTASYRPRIHAHKLPVPAKHTSDPFPVRPAFPPPSRISATSRT